MIKVENKYDFTVEELTDILNNTPIAVDMSTNAAVAEYIIQALNINRIIKSAHGTISGTEPSKTVYHKDAPYHLVILRNRDDAKVFECDARTVAFYAYDPLLGKPHKGILSEQKPKPTDIANVCELLGDINGWGTFQ
jgi:hypothetical protein